MAASSPPAPALDPDLSALPRPRRPWRRATLAIMALTTVLAAALSWQLRDLGAYALRGTTPVELGDLTGVQLGPTLENAWVHAVGTVSGRGVEYRRPLDRDRFRLVQSEQSPRLWVELRVPGDLEASRYVPPNSFVGRLVPLGHAGIRHAVLPGAIETALGSAPAPDAWVLVDGEAPATTRWVLAMIPMLLAFAAYNAWGIVRLLRPVRAPRPVAP